MTTGPGCRGRLVIYATASGPTYLADVSGMQWSQEMEMQMRMHAELAVVKKAGEASNKASKPKVQRFAAAAAAVLG